MSEKNKKDFNLLTSQHYSNFSVFSRNHSVTFILKDHLAAALCPCIKGTESTKTQDRIDRFMSALIETAFENEDVMREVERKLKQ